MDKPFSLFADVLIREFEKDETPSSGRKISVNPIVSKVASIYEKLRNAMDYRDEEVILRAAIERILKRRFLFGGTGKSIAEPLVRELVWARYFPDESLSESIIEKIGKKIDLYSKLHQNILLKHPSFSEKTINQLIYQLMSSDLEHILGKPHKKEVMTNFIFRIMRENISIIDDSEQTRDAQVFIAIHKSFAKDDLALLYYHLFNQYFGEISEKNLEETSSDFLKGYREINYQLNYPRKDRIYNFVKDKTAVFFILEDLLNLEKGNVRELYKSEKDFDKIVFEICESRYEGISSKVRRAIFRSVIFILLTKAFFALAIEGTYESVFYGRILWTSTLLNIGVPPFLMAAVGFLIRGPSQNNSKRILSYIKLLLTSDSTKFKNPLQIKKNPDKIKPLLNSIFTLLWLATFLLAFGIIIFFLGKLHFNIVSLGIFVFFLAIVSFLSYRINQSAHIYSIEEKKNILAPVVDFLLMPFVRVGRHLTEGISQINLFIFILDFIIETPFKGLFGFFEQWFLFLQAKREELE
ncbi:MAG: hypothetical protein ABH816_02095 [Candidatus Levyibacteriota bacterium]